MMSRIMIRLLKPLLVLADYVGWNMMFSFEYGKITLDECCVDFEKIYEKYYG